MAEIKAGTGGDRYVPYPERTGNESIVYFTRDLSPEGIAKIYERVKGNISGKVAIKLHTGEPKGPNIIPATWVKEFMAKELPYAAIVETNTYYEGDRYTTEQHRETTVGRTSPPSTSPTSTAQQCFRSRAANGSQR